MSKIEHQLHIPKLTVLSSSHNSQLQLAIVNGKEFDFMAEMNKHLGLGGGATEDKKPAAEEKETPVAAATGLEGEWSTGVMDNLMADFTRRMSRIEKGLPAEKGYEKDHRETQKEQKDQKDEPHKEDHAELREANSASESLVAATPDEHDDGESQKNKALKEQHKDDWLQRVNQDAWAAQEQNRKQEVAKQAVQEKEDEKGGESGIYSDFLADLNKRMSKVEQEFNADSPKDDKKPKDGMPTGDPKPDGVPPGKSDSEKSEGEKKGEKKEEEKKKDDKKELSPVKEKMQKKWNVLKVKAKGNLNTPEGKQQRAKLAVAKQKAQALSAKTTESDKITDDAKPHSSLPEMDLLRQKTEELVAFGKKISSDFQDSDKTMDVSNANAWFAGEMA